jgi:hypothetical protein
MHVPAGAKSSLIMQVLDGVQSSLDIMQVPDGAK